MVDDVELHQAGEAAELAGLIAEPGAYGGDGVFGLIVLASPHAFQGWAEVFVTKPVDGLIDLYAKATYGFPPVEYLGKFAASFAYHDFSAQRTDAGLGHEWDAALEARLNEHFSYGGSFALYQRGGTYPSKHVFWLYATYVY